MATDQPLVAALVQAGMRERWGNAFDPRANPDLDNVWASYMTDGAILLVATDHDDDDEGEGGEVVGTGALVPDPAGRRIVRMSVDRRMRRRGVGRALVAALLDRAWAMGEQRVVVSTDTPWTEAVALYVACGFEIIDVDDVDTHLAIVLAS